MMADTTDEINDLGEGEVLHDDAVVQPVGVGQTLSDARREAGLDLAQVSAETRIPERHLLAIENGDFGALPARTYAVGFSRTYAKMLGLDDKEISERVRQELGASGGDNTEHLAKFEPGDPARVPSRGLAWFGVIAALLLLGGIYAFYNTYFAPGMGPAPLEDDAQLVEAEETDPAAVPDAADGVDPTGEVVFTALEDGIWVKFYDAAGERLYEAQMAKDERYVVPADAEGPQIWTGRPDAFGITVGGQAIPKLAEEDFVMKDQPITAQALLAREDEVSTEQAGDAANAT